MQQVTEANFDSVSKHEKALLEFSAPWCGPCRQQQTVLEELDDSENNIFFGKVDIEEAMEVAKKFEIKSVPTLILLTKGKEKERLIGFQQRDRVEAALHI